MSALQATVEMPERAAVWTRRSNRSSAQKFGSIAARSRDVQNNLNAKKQCFLSAATPANSRRVGYERDHMGNWKHYASPSSNKNSDQREEQPDARPGRSDTVDVEKQEMSRQPGSKASKKPDCLQDQLAKEFRIGPMPALRQTFACVATSWAKVEKLVASESSDRQTKRSWIGLVIGLWWRQCFDLRTTPKSLSRESKGPGESERRQRINGNNTTSSLGWTVGGPCHHIGRKGGVDGNVNLGKGSQFCKWEMLNGERSSVRTLHNVGATDIEVSGKMFDQLKQGFVEFFELTTRVESFSIVDALFRLSGVVRGTGVSEQRRRWWLVRRVESNSRVRIDGPYAAAEGSIGLILMLSGIESRTCMKILEAAKVLARERRVPKSPTGEK
ncbi:hypothetical protein B0H11DRAFT_1925113 [Mycena galericulata]|nr:hypothetical protein B0H11DRAFT_1925113 [Mycena galericulata]